jgi:hypothetical protein
MRKEKSAAIVTIYHAPAMTKKGRKAVADWLRYRADDLEKHGKEFTEGRFTARYIYA